MMLKVFSGLYDLMILWLFPWWQFLIWIHSHEHIYKYEQNLGTIPISCQGKKRNKGNGYSGLGFPKVKLAQNSEAQNRPTHHVDEKVEFGLCYLNSYSSNGMKLQYAKIQRIACNMEFTRNLILSGKREMRGRSFRNMAHFQLTPVRRVGLQVVFSHSLVLL